MSKSNETISIKAASIREVLAGDLIEIDAREAYHDVRAFDDPAAWSTAAAPVRLVRVVEVDHRLTEDGEYYDSYKVEAVQPTYGPHCPQWVWPEHIVRNVSATSRALNQGRVQQSDPKIEDEGPEDPKDFEGEIERVEAWMSRVFSGTPNRHTQDLRNTQVGILLEEVAELMESLDILTKHGDLQIGRGVTQAVKNLGEGLQRGDYKVAIPDKVATLDALLDILWMTVAVGWVEEYNMTGAFTAVEGSNYSKLSVFRGVTFKDAGQTRVGKGLGYYAPNLQDFTTTTA